MTVLLQKSNNFTSVPPDKPVKILLAGLHNSGKSSICEKLSGLPLSTIERIAASSTVEYHLPQSVMQTVIWVPPGQVRSREDLHSHGGTIEPETVFSAVDVFGFVVDSTDRGLFGHARSELEHCLRDLKVYSPLISEVYILAHKQDQKNAMPVEEVANILNHGMDPVLAKMIAPRATSIYNGTAERWFLEIRRKFFPYERHPLLKREIGDLKADLSADSVILMDGLGLPVVSSISDAIDEELVCAAFSHLLSGEERYQKTRFPDINYFRGEQLYMVYQFSEGLVFVLKLDESLYLFIDNPSVPLGMVVLHASRASNRITALI
jgi:predicted regulator of Ras-like GTPase activity (Roadblock/LC7/MglB family)/signal recognition particle receptor subunit beta